MNKNVLLLLRVMVEMTLAIYILMFHISQKWLSPVGVWRLGGLQSACFLTVRQMHQNAVFLCMAGVL